MKPACILTAALCGLGIAGAAPAQVMMNVQHDQAFNAFDGVLADNDLIADKIATELEGDLGWHPANPASGAPEHPFGLSTFTNGVGNQGAVDGLLNDFPGDGLPTKKVQYDFDGPVDIGAINILTGNSNDPDGRVFNTVVIRISKDNGATFTNFAGEGGTVTYDPKPFVDPNEDVIDGDPFEIPNGDYFQSDPTGTVNSPDTTAWSSTFMNIMDASGVLATGVTNIQFDFYAVHHNDNTIEDPFFGENPFTGVDDNLQPLTGDADGDGDVDAFDLGLWQTQFGMTGDGLTADFDDDGDVDAFDLGLWQTNFGGEAEARLSHPQEPWPITSPLVWEIDVLAPVATAAIPEPGTAMLALAGLVAAGLRRRV